jgi:iron complex outermembrane receptor protein
MKFFAAMQLRGPRRSSRAIGFGLLACTSLSSAAFAQDAETAKSGEEIVVSGSLNALPVKDVGTVFGFDKTLVETPRSASTVSKEQLERFGVTEHLRSRRAGARHVHQQLLRRRRLARHSRHAGRSLFPRHAPPRQSRQLPDADRRGRPDRHRARPGLALIMGRPRRAATSTSSPRRPAPQWQLSRRAEGRASAIRAAAGTAMCCPATSSAPARSPAMNSATACMAKSPIPTVYYDNIFTHQTLLQALDRHGHHQQRCAVEFGGMYDNYRGTQNGGWNRVTQELIDNGTYITGAAKPLDTNGDGKISQAEVNANRRRAGDVRIGLLHAPAFANPFIQQHHQRLPHDVYPHSGLTNPGTAISAAGRR